MIYPEEAYRCATTHDKVVIAIDFGSVELRGCHDDGRCLPDNASTKVLCDTRHREVGTQST